MKKATGNINWKDQSTVTDITSRITGEATKRDVHRVARKIGSDTLKRVIRHNKREY